MSALSIVIIEKSGESKTLNVKSFCLDELYKKCGFKSAVHFQKVFEFSHESVKLQIFGKINGRECNQNKYNYSRFGENKKLYGNVAIIAWSCKESIFTNFTAKMLQLLNTTEITIPLNHHSIPENKNVVITKEPIEKEEETFDATEIKMLNEPELIENIYTESQSFENILSNTNKTTTDFRIRNKIRCYIDRLLNNMFFSYNLEVGIYNYVLKEANQNQLVKKWDNILFRKIYFARVKTIMVNLTDSIVQKITDHELKPEKVAFMTHQELSPEIWKESIAKKIIRDQNKFEVKLEATTDAFTCRKCGSNKCSHYLLQTRSADEPMTVYVTCLNCDKRWKC